MQIKELFKTGMSFNQFIETDEESYRAKASEVIENISFDEKHINQIKEIDETINILICGEVWCADCMINIPVVEKMHQYNEKINISIFNKEITLKFKDELNSEGSIKLPTFIVYDKNFNELGRFIEYPSKIKKIIEDGNESKTLVSIRKYRKGEYAEEVLNDILEIINRRD